jgi:Transglutaminase-like superfamily
MLLNRYSKEKFPPHLFRLLTTLFWMGLISVILSTGTEAKLPIPHWDKISRLKPDLRVMIQVKSPTPLSLVDLASLAQMGMNPADRDPGLVLGLRQAIFSVRLRHWKPGNLPTHLQAKLLDQFIMSGIYRVSFKVEEKGYEGPLSMEITAPRDGFGQQLVSSESIARPQAPHRLHTDSAGNHWFCIDYPKIRYGETIRFHFAFRYRVDLTSLLEHDLMLSQRAEQAPIPEDIQRFLSPGNKIDTQIPEAIEWAQAGDLPGPANVRLEYLRVKQYFKKTIRYDDRKKARYFGAKAVYSNLDEMYQDPPITLAQKIGACPDTSVLECAFLRAKGIPCRTAGRFGHFLTHLYVPGRGWFSTAIHPTGIPLIVAPGPDNVSYQKWSPSIALRTVTLTSKIRIEPLEEQP